MASKKVYHCKVGMEKEYNMFYHGYSREQQSAALETQLAARRAKGDCCPPPPLAPLTSLFSGLVRLVQSEVVLQVFFTFLFFTNLLLIFYLFYFLRLVL